MKIANLIFILCFLSAYGFGQNLKQLQTQLEEIYEKDQKYRISIPAISKKFGPNSNEMKELWKKMAAQDSSNIPVVTQILDAYGWLGKDKIGSKANNTLFLVIQHADQKTQEKYLPMMRKAVKEGDAQAGNLALLEDRVALRQGKKQMYGSQIYQDSLTGKFYVAPLQDPENVDKRRARMGLGPLREYVKQWDIVLKPSTELSPANKENKASPGSLACDKEIDFIKVNLPHIDFEFSPYYLSDNKLFGFTLTINPTHFEDYKITCIDGKPVGEQDYRYDKRTGVFLVKVEGVKSEKELYPSTLIIDGKGYYFHSLTPWYNYKKL